ncbi:helix-turn-helix domain-containing protein [Blautia producta]
MYIHRNSLLYRLKRIEELTGIDLDNEEIRLHLMLSYLLEE